MNNENIKKILKFLNTKKNTNLQVIDITNISNVLFDYLIILSMDNLRAVDSITDDIIDLLYKENIKIKSIEGKNTQWIVIDCFDYVIHIFTEEERKYYNLEKIWADGKIIELNKIILE